MRLVRLVPVPASSKCLTIGVGALSLPYTARLSGLAGALLMLFLMAVVNTYTLHILSDLSVITGCTSMETLAEHYFGRRMRYMVQGCMLVFCFGCLVAYMLAVGDILAPLANAVFHVRHPHGPAFYMTVFTLAIMLPLSMVRNPDSLRFASVVAVVAVGFLATALAVRSAERAEEVRAFSFSGHYFTSFQGYSLAFPIIVFSFSCQAQFFSIQEGCGADSMKFVIETSMSIIFVVYGTIMCFAYVSCLENTSENVLTNFPFIRPVDGSFDFYMAFTHLAYAITLILGFPLNVFPCRHTVEMLFQAADVENGADPRQPVPRLVSMVISFCIVMAALLLAVVTPGIDVILGLLGASAASLLSFIVPASCRVAQNIRDRGSGGLFDSKQILPVLTIILGVGVAVWSSYVYLRDKVLHKASETEF